jgi:hypothetical protein
VRKRMVHRGGQECEPRCWKFLIKKQALQSNGVAEEIARLRIAARR